MERIKRLIIGVSTAPAVVAAVRGFLFYALPLGVGALVAYLGAIHDPRWLWLGGLIPVIRAIEGALIDQVFKRDQNQRNPPPVAGSGDAGSLP